MPMPMSHAVNLPAGLLLWNRNRAVLRSVGHAAWSGWLPWRSRQHSARAGTLARSDHKLLPVYQSVRMSHCLCLCLSRSLSVSVSLYVSLSLSLSVCVSVSLFCPPPPALHCLCLCLSLSLCVSVCLSLRLFLSLPLFPMIIITVMVDWV